LAQVSGSRAPLFVSSFSFFLLLELHKMRPSSSFDAPAASLMDASAANADKRQWTTFLLLLAACFIDGADMQLLPSCFRALEAELGFTPVKLGYLSMIQALFMASMAPFWGSVADTGLLSKRMLLSGGTGGWGLFTILLSTTSNFYSMLIIRAFIGACLACILPLSQAIIARQAGPQDRGTLFGWVGFAWVMGQASASLLATSISTTPFWVADTIVMGWRVAFLIVGFASIALSMVIAVFLHEPQQTLNQRLEGMSLREVLQDVLQRAGPYFRIPTFRIIVIQGLFGTVPWAALNFLPMFFQYVGFEDKKAAILMAIMFIAMGPGNIVGGYLGDFAAKYSRHHGRIVVAQISVFAGVPCMAVLFGYVTPSTTNFLPYACVLCCGGLFASWTMGGVKRPMLSEIVRPGDWASLLALDSAFEGASGAIFGAPLVGLLAQHAFEYKASTGLVRDLSPEIRHRNQHALASGMCWMTLIPWTICFLNWSFLHITYPRDLQALEGCEAEDEIIVSNLNEDAPLLSFKDDGCMTGY